MAMPIKVQVPALPGSLELTEEEQWKEPSFAGRYVIIDGVATNQGFGGEHVSGGQRWVYMLPPELYFEDHPEYYALVNGQRTWHQVCGTNPEVIQKFGEEAFLWQQPTAAFPMSPNDNDAFCECQECLASRQGGNVTDQIVAFYNAVIEAADKMTAADTTLYAPTAYSLLAYSVYTKPPLKVKPDRRIIPMICRIGWAGHGLEPGELRKLIRGWKHISPVVVIYEYVGGYKWFGYLPNLPTLVNDIRIYKEERIDVVQSECHPHWATQGRDMWTVQMLLWNHRQSLDELTKRWCKGLYGAAWETMYEFYGMLDDMQGLFEEGSPQEWSWVLFNNQKVAQLRCYLNRAMEESKDDVEAQRWVELARIGLDFTRAWANGLLWTGTANMNGTMDIPADNRKVRYYLKEALRIARTAPRNAFQLDHVEHSLNHTIERYGGTKLEK